MSLPEEANGYDSPSRLDRIEGLVEAIAASQMDLFQSHKQLLTAQIILHDEVTQIAVAQKRTDTALADLTDVVAHLSAKIDALVNVSDDLVRRQKPN